MEESSILINTDAENPYKMARFANGDDEATSSQASNIVAFNEPYDPGNPRAWSIKYKWAIVALMSAMNLSITLGTLIAAPAAPSIMSSLHAPDATYLNLLVSIWELGEACGPLVVAPASELFGRAPIYHICNILFVIFSTGGALSPNIETVVAFRFLQGLSVASVTLDASVVGDLFPSEVRGKAMALGNLAPLIGPIAGPVVGGYIAQTIGWRWTFWLPAIMAGFCECGFVVLFRETYKVQILRNRTRRLRREFPEKKFQSMYEESTTTENFRNSLMRPFVMLCKSPALLSVAVYVAVVFGYLYLLLTTIEEAFQKSFGLLTGEASLAYMGLGMTAGIFFCQCLLDKFVSKINSTRPESRLIPVAIAGAVIPFSLVLYGWTLQFCIHWIAPILGLAMLGFALVLTFIPAFTYLVDAFGTYSASAVAGSITLRCITGAVLPLAGPSLYGKLHQGWGNTVLALIAIALLPVPLLLIKYGERLRRTSSLRITYS